MIGFELGLKINFHGGGWVCVGVRLTSASTGFGVEVGAELGNKMMVLVSLIKIFSKSFVGRKTSLQMRHGYISYWRHL